MASQMCGLKAPGHVYAGTLQNTSDNDVTVEVEYGGSDSSHRETMNVTVPKGGSQRLEEKSVQVGDNEQRKVIQKLTVRSQDGTTNELSAPFAGVTSPKANWQFEVGQDGSLRSVS
ncbi:unnamed protein product [Rotaria sordida]|uniref:Uncharacterized protein n=1 Tax=Rotaria sordida TaxID=392033 RepID=A0A814IJ38_9BILA|nr:unnamed protein product [Rotaria sordida]CAF1023469.1 unnamed protein product [Rotaria sordida]CAF1024165.1 unnamed protein product [Rotaria sordida]